MKSNLFFFPSSFSLFTANKKNVVFFPSFLPFFFIMCVCVFADKASVRQWKKASEIKGKNERERIYVSIIYITG